MKERFTTRLVLAAALAAALGTGALAQDFTQPHSDSFTFATGAAISRYSIPPSCGAITAWDGNANAYPYAMGEVCVGGYNASIEVPFQLGYLNNGNLATCNPIVWGSRTYTMQSPTMDQYTMTGITTCPYYTGEYGTDENSNNRQDGFSVTADFTVVKWQVIYRGRVYNYSNTILTGGSGEVSETILN